MAVAFDGTRITNADALAPTTPVAGDWEDIGGAGATLEDNFFYQGDYCVAELVKSSEFGVDFIPDTDTYNGASLVWLLKTIVTTSGLLGTTRATGLKLEIGSGGTAGSGRPSDYHQWYIAMLTTYPAKGGWVLSAINTSELGFIDNTVGSPSMTAINYWAAVATMTITGIKSPNVALDAIDYVAVGAGLTWTGTGGEFQDFIDFDEGTVANRYGVVSTNDGVLSVVATLTIGSSAQCTFTDSNKKLVFPFRLVGEGTQGVAVDLSHADTAITLSVCSFTGNGQSSIKKWFDTKLEVDGATEVVTVVNHGWSTGDYVEYNNEGGTSLTNLTSGNSYWVYVISADTVALHATRASAYGDTTRINLTAAGTGQNQSFTRNPDNRADFTVTGTTATAGLVSTSCIYEGIRVMTLTSKCAITSGFIQNIGNVTASTAALTSVLISDMTLGEGDALFTPLASMNGITYCSFDGGGDRDGGHAMEITATGSTNSVGNLFENYWQPTVSGSDKGWNFHTQDGVDASTEVITTNAAHGFTTGDAVFYNNEGGTDTIGVTHGNKYYVNVASTTTFTLHLTRAEAIAGTPDINLTDGATGETHSFYSAKATVFNDTGGAVTINVSGGGDSPSFRNGTSASTTVVNTKTLTVTCKLGATAIAGLRVRVENAAGGALIMSGTTNASGVVTDATYNYTGDVSVNVIVRLKGWQNYRATDTITSSGLSHAASMTVDENVDLP
jgi:hypothetical protein